MGAVTRHWREGVVGAAAAAFVAVVLLTDDPRLDHDSTLDAVFDSRVLVAAARLLAAVVIVYLLGSVAVRVRRGQWVRGAASLETDAPTQRAFDDSDRMEQSLLAADRLVAELQNRLAEATRDRERLVARLR